MSITTYLPQVNTQLQRPRENHLGTHLPKIGNYHIESCILYTYNNVLQAHLKVPRGRISHIDRLGICLGLVRLCSGLDPPHLSREEGACENKRRDSRTRTRTFHSPIHCRIIMLLRLVPSIEDNALDLTPDISRYSGTYYRLVASLFFFRRERLQHFTVSISPNLL